MTTNQITQHHLMSPRQRNGWLLGRGNLPLYYRMWLPDKQSRAAVLITHGLGDHSGRYTAIAESLCSHGYAVFALDQRGHGRSAGPRTAGNIDDSVADLSTMVSLIRRDLPDRKVFLVGHSWGGLLTLAYAVDHENDIDGITLSAPAGRANVSALSILLAKIVSGLAPNAGVVKLPYDKACSDPSVVAAQRHDPLTYQGPVRARMASQTLTAIKKVNARLPSMPIPVLLLHGTADEFAEVANSQRIYDTVGSTDKTLKLYEGLWHQLFNEPARETVYADVRDWLDHHSDKP
jgi:acylglycerol lipase